MGKDPRNLGIMGEKGKGEIFQRPCGEENWKREMSNRGYIFFLKFAESCAM
jgi:hypothetical protein